MLGPLRPVIRVCGLFRLMRAGFHPTYYQRLETLPFYLSLTQSWVYLPIDGNALIYQFGLVPAVTRSIGTERFFYAVFPFLCIPVATLRTARAVVLFLIGICAFAFVALLLIDPQGDVDRASRRSAVRRYCREPKGRLLSLVRLFLALCAHPGIRLRLPRLCRRPVQRNISTSAPAWQQLP
jgi:peptidoglycan/LPS O-acetylase OafA/YrhL